MGSGVLAAVLMVTATEGQARSNAAEYLIREEIAAACDGGAGSIDPTAVIERDLTGDGRADLIISHEGIRCAGEGRSIFCGLQVCSVKVYVRRGQLLDPEVEDLLGMTVTVGDGAVPVIRWFGHDGTGHSMSWNGQAFR